MSAITTFNSAVSRFVNRDDETYKAIFGEEGFVPDATVDSSDDINCGAFCNEVEYLKRVADYYVQSFDTDVAEGENLDSLVEGFIDLPRRNRGETDTVYRDRFKSIAVGQTYPRRTNKWAILQSISYFIDDMSTVQVIERFDDQSLFFEVRFEGGVDLDSALFLNNNEQGYLDQNFVGGEGIGSVVTFIGRIIERVKAAGVDFDVLFIIQDRFTKTVDVRIGTVQKYFDVDAWVKLVSQSLKTVDAQVV